MGSVADVGHAGLPTVRRCSSPPTRTDAVRSSRSTPFSGAVTRLTNDDYAYTDVHPAPDGVRMRMRSSYAQPPHPVRIDPDGDRHGTALR